MPVRSRAGRPCGKGSPHRQGARQGFAGHACARHEKTAEDHLGKLGYETILPLMRRERQWADSIEVLESPAFPRYVLGEELGVPAGLLEPLRS